MTAGTSCRPCRRRRCPPPDLRPPCARWAGQGSGGLESRASRRRRESFKKETPRPPWLRTGFRDRREPRGRLGHHDVDEADARLDHAGGDARRPPTTREARDARVFNIGVSSACFRAMPTSEELPEVVRLSRTIVFRASYSKSPLRSASFSRYQSLLAPGGPRLSGGNRSRPLLTALSGGIDAAI